MQLLVQESFLCSWPTEIGAPGSRGEGGGQLLTWWEIFFINEIGNLNRASQVDLLPDFEDFQFTKLDKVSNLRQNIWYLGNSNCVTPQWLARLWGFQKLAFLQWNSICCHFHHNPSLPQSSSANCAKVVERSFPRRRNVSSSTLKPMCHHLCHHQHRRSHHLGVSNHFLRVIITLPLLPHLTSQAFSPKIMLSVHFKLPACHFGERLTNNGWQLSGKHYGEETFFQNLSKSWSSLLLCVNISSVNGFPAAALSNFQYSWQ